MDDKLFAFLVREKLRDNYKNTPFNEDEITDELIPEEEDNSIEWERK
jgi:hypothetical protein